MAHVNVEGFKGLRDLGLRNFSVSKGFFRVARASFFPIPF